MAENLTIGMIGDGNVGSALAQGLERAGYEVETTGKDPQRVREIAENSDIIFLAVPYTERRNALEEMGDAVQGKTIVDVTNALNEDRSFAHDLNTSGAEELQEWAEGAHIVKAFNTVFAQNMPKGKLQGEPVSLFLAGDDEEAKRRVEELGSRLGFEPVDAGPLQNARWLEALGYFHIQLGYGQNMGTDVEFRLVQAGKATAKKAARASNARGRTGTRRPTPPQRRKDAARTRSR